MMKALIVQEVRYPVVSLPLSTDMQYSGQEGGCARPPDPFSWRRRHSRQDGRRRSKPDRLEM